MPELPPKPSLPQSGVRIELKIPATSEWVRVARLTVAGVASRLNFGIDDIEDIKLAVAEAINNAIQHSPAPDNEHEPPVVTLAIEVRGDGLQISVIDEGHLEEGLPISASETPTFLFSDDLPEGGLGLSLIQSLMDEVSHDSGPDADTTLRMFKRLPARASS